MSECVRPDVLVNKIVIDSFVAPSGELALIMSTGEVFLIGTTLGGQAIMMLGE